MSAKPNLKMIGIFIVCGIVAFLAVIGIFIRQKFGGDSHNMLVMYFEESIRGLSVGAPVVLKGVEIGKVSKIDLIANPKTLDFSTPVYVKLEDYQSIRYREKDNKEEILDALVGKGLRGRLALQSYLTGQLLIELVMVPDSKVVWHGKRNSDGNILEIPTVLSQMGEISKGIQNMPIRQSVEGINKFFADLNQQLPQTMTRLNNVLDGLDKVVGRNGKVSVETVNNINRAAVEIGKAARSWRNFADYAEQHPESFLRGKGR